MPFLRVIRDKRGYETTYLMHWFRDGNRQRTRILYAFRTPGGVRVGRDPLEPAVLREIEAQHPDIAFEWKVIRDNQQIIEPAIEQRRRRPKASDGAAAAAPAVSPARAAPAGAPDPARETADRPKPVPSTIAGATPDEQVAFLTEWYGAIRERIDKRISDPARRVTLHALAERLNPAAWTDADQITAGLQQAGEALERLARVFARRRRRGRRRAVEQQPPPPTSEAS
ncbi:MAG TPA: hypothetical protein VFO21_08375 [Vicinamibacterales bacterium]|nr:hypothetical protein [Vicinamibacterales bacterium]